MENIELAPPPEEDYGSREELLTAVRSWAANHGYAVTIARSDTAKGRVYLKCDRGGLYRNKYDLSDETRSRQTGSRLINCPFSVVGNQIEGRWVVRVRDKEHNHSASSTTAAHPSLRRLTAKQKEEVATLSKAGAAPRTITAALRHDSTSGQILTTRDIYNARLQLRAENLRGKPPIQALVDEFRTNDVIWRVSKDPYLSE